MRYKHLGNTGVAVSELCMGTMTFGKEADEPTSRALFERCIEAGINTFDCADVYVEGRSEQILGALISERRDQLVIATKAYFPTGDGPNERGGSRYHLVRACEASLRRLSTDRIDLYYLHRFDDRTHVEESLRGLELLVQQGKIVYPAFSNFAAWQVAHALGTQALHSWAPAACIQPMYNLLKRQAEVELLPMAQSLGLGVFPYSPLAGGLLSGKYVDHEEGEDLGRLSHNTMYQTRYGKPSYAQSVREFVALAREAGHHPVSLAIAWAGAHPVVTAPIIGARNVAQLDAALGAVDIEMSQDLYERLAAITETPPPATDRSEEREGHHYKAR